MCGITFVLDKSKNNRGVEIALQSLSQLQNRGYDSFGIGCWNDDSKNIEIIKEISNPDMDYDKFQTNNLSLKYNYCIGHTRWATHGRITKANTHPHTSYNKLFTIVHNGIIENFNSLKRQLIEKDILFETETDTEVIANMIEQAYLLNNNVTKSIQTVIDQCEGTYGLVIYCKNTPKNIRATSNSISRSRTTNTSTSTSTRHKKI